ncbi:MAG: hypothetical protein H9W81_04335 [Enterococcus sp.]|nr:hypothetical protein [Enterococcus sp.]
MSIFDNKKTGNENDSLGEKAGKLKDNVKETLSSNRDAEDKPAGVKEDTKDAFTGARPESLGEHKDGEDAGQWLRNDLEQTKQDVHIGGSRE